MANQPVHQVKKFESDASFDQATYYTSHVPSAVAREFASLLTEKAHHG
jgi:hypothetical protein